MGWLNHSCNLVFIKHKSYLLSTVYSSASYKGKLFIYLYYYRHPRLGEISQPSKRLISEIKLLMPLTLLFIAPPNLSTYTISKSVFHTFLMQSIPALYTIKNCETHHPLKDDTSTVSFYLSILGLSWLLPALLLLPPQQTNRRQQKRQQRDHHRDIKKRRGAG